MRYEKECLQLAEMAKTALNLPKNVCKGEFETLPTTKIFSLLKMEIEELKNELFFHFPFSGEDIPVEKIDIERAYEELSDVVACCVGLLAKINSMKKEIKSEI